MADQPFDFASFGDEHNIDQTKGQLKPVMLLLFSIHQLCMETGFAKEMADAIVIRTWDALFKFLVLDKIVTPPPGGAS
jgi:hypothetical protein